MSDKRMAKYEFVACYIMASKRNETIYTGVTSDLMSRVLQHRDGSASVLSALAPKIARPKRRRALWGTMRLHSLNSQRRSANCLAKVFLEELTNALGRIETAPQRNNTQLAG
jgi:hypothetical protein